MLERQLREFRVVHTTLCLSFNPFNIQSTPHFAPLVRIQHGYTPLCGADLRSPVPVVPAYLLFQSIDRLWVSVCLYLFRST